MTETLAPPRLTTERLILRPPELRDAPNIQRLAGEYEVVKGTLTMPHPYEDGMAEEFITRTQTQFEEKTGYPFAIALKDTDELIGVIGLHPVAAYQRAEIGYWIGVPYWNKGYVTESATAVMRFGFEVVGLNRIYASHYTDNPASGKVMQKLGMTYEGTLRQHLRRFESYKDVAFYGILRDEYMERQNGD
ncbi:MAG: GNAT family N-acetyltransferase [Aggregatilineales bacterium]